METVMAIASARVWCCRLTPTVSMQERQRHPRRRAIATMQTPPSRRLRRRLRATRQTRTAMVRRSALWMLTATDTGRPGYRRVPPGTSRVPMRARRARLPVQATATTRAPIGTPDSWSAATGLITTAMCWWTTLWRHRATIRMVTATCGEMRQPRLWSAAPR